MDIGAPDYWNKRRREAGLPPSDNYMLDNDQLEEYRRRDAELLAGRAAADRAKPGPWRYVIPSSLGVLGGIALSQVLRDRFPDFNPLRSLMN